MEFAGRKIKVAIADDQLIFRQGLENLLNSFANVEVVLTAENGLDLFNKLEDANPDLAILDFRMPVMNGLETTRKIRINNPTIRVLILSMYDDSEFVESAIESGANGYLSKDDEPDEIARAIYSTVETGYYLNDRTSKMLITKLMHQGKMNPHFVAPHEEFTDAEMEILKLICAEYTTQEIAEKVCKSKRTVEGCRTMMMQKIGARNVVGLVMYAVKHNLLD
jgi:two-component system, NarL family, response regulator NreC